MNTEQWLARIREDMQRESDNGTFGTLEYYAAYDGLYVELTKIDYVRREDCRARIDVNLFGQTFTRDYWRVGLWGLAAMLANLETLLDKCDDFIVTGIG